jgi:maltose O-acetyltransferase
VSATAHGEPETLVSSQKQKMLTGELYRADDAELVEDRLRADRILRSFNDASPNAAQERATILSSLCGSLGTGVVIRPPFYCDYGYNIAIGSNVFINFNCIVLDVCRIEIGDGCQIGPLVQLLTADHPRDPAKRRDGLEMGKRILIGKNVWIGAGAIILPGITVGDDAIIGAGSVVTRDVLPGVTVVGNPARACR